MKKLLKNTWNDYYAVYRGDKFIDLGTKRELMVKYNLSETTMNWNCQPSVVRKKDKKGQRVFIRIEED